MYPDGGNWRTRSYNRGARSGVKWWKNMRRNASKIAPTNVMKLDWSLLPRSVQTETVLFYLNVPLMNALYSNFYASDYLRLPSSTALLLPMTLWQIKPCHMTTRKRAVL